MSNVILFTQAYNAEKTLRMAMDSVMNQTCKNFVYYVLDNGSTDKTGKIIHEYMENDARVRFVRNEKNYKDFFYNLALLRLTHEKYDYFSMLDADDEYAPNFLEGMLGFAEENNLDIACCGSDFINAVTHKVVGQRILPINMILNDNNDFNSNFPVYYQFVRTIWGKVIRSSIMNSLDLEALSASECINGSDTLFSLTAFKQAKRVGIMSGTSHRYYMYQKSAYSTYHSSRFRSTYFLFDAAENFLIDRCSFVSPNNKQFLFIVYMESVKDAVRVMLNSHMEAIEKIQNLLDIVTHEKTQQLFNGDYVNDNELEEKLRKPILGWILAQNECRSSEGAKYAAEILMAMYHSARLVDQSVLEYMIMKMPEMIECLLEKKYEQILIRIKTWLKRHGQDDPFLTELEIVAYDVLNKPCNERFKLLADIRKKRPRSSDALDVDTQIYKLIQENPLLKDISSDLAVALSDTIYSILKENFQQALKAFISVSKSIEIADKDIQDYITLGQNISAAAENMDAYIFFKKMWISYLIDHLRTGEAKDELDEWLKLLPGDEALISLQARLSCEASDIDDRKADMHNESNDRIKPNN